MVVQTNTLKPQLLVVKKGEYVFEEGDEAVFAYVLTEGVIEIVAVIKGEEQVLGKVEKGTVFGEMAIIDGFPRSASARAEVDCKVQEVGHKESLNYITSNFSKIDEPNNKILFDVANFYKKSKNYKEAIKYYTKIISNLDDSIDVKSDLLYRRGGSYERMKNYEKADKDLLHALKISPDDAYILNYLAYSWLERDYKINEAIEMLEIAYASKNNDPYIIDSIGWAYYLIDDYLKAEKFLKRAVELMPDDPIVNDHYGDILWKLGRKIQARYFWANVLKMDDAEKDMIEKINIKMIKGLKNS